MTELSQPPLVFILPGLDDDDRSFEQEWGPLQGKLRLVKIERLDWTDLIEPGSGVHTMVAHVKRQIDSYGDIGPVRIAGYSIGGFLGYYCALALQAEGRPALRLVILDIPAPNYIATGRISLGRRLRARFRRFFPVDLRKGLGSVLSKFVTQPALIPYLRRFSRFRHHPLPFDMGRYLHYKITWQMEIDQILCWNEATTPPSPPLSAPTTVLLSEDYDSSGAVELAWRQYCRDVTLLRVPGDHETMLQPPNRDRLFSIIERALTGEDSRLP